MEHDRTLPSISIIIEWDNALQTDSARVECMLTALRKQLIELEEKLAAIPELLIVFDRKQVMERDLKAFIISILGEDFNAAVLRYVSGDDLQYYQLKNLGAEKSSNELLVFLDSDVVPTSEWLVNLLLPFAIREIHVVAGQCNFDQHSILDKTFAMFWYFPLPNDSEELIRINILYANNFAIYKSLFESIRFPDAEYFRGQCVEFSENLRRRGETIHLSNRACVKHPAPSGSGYFLRRALCEGHDYELKDQKFFHSSVPSRTYTKWYYGKSLKLAFRSIRRKYRDVGLGPGGAALAMMIASCYLTIVATGKLVTRYWPDIIPRYFAI